MKYLQHFPFQISRNKFIYIVLLNTAFLIISAFHYWLQYVKVFHKLLFCPNIVSNLLCCGNVIFCALNVQWKLQKLVVAYGFRLRFTDVFPDCLSTIGILLVNSYYLTLHEGNKTYSSNFKRNGKDRKIS